jgi:hypothetical protein
MDAVSTAPARSAERERAVTLTPPRIPVPGAQTSPRAIRSIDPKGNDMPAKNPVTSSAQPPKIRMSAVERRAAEMVLGASRQAELKAEAAERRAARALRELESPTRPRAVAARRPRPR